jgi:hypothetical protein
MGAINVGAGFAAAGAAIADTAGKWTLQSQRDDAEKEKLKLIQDFTAGENVKQREFSRGERIEGQQYQSGEKVLDREQQTKITQMNNENAVRTAQISAGPGYASVAQRKAEFEAGAPMRQAELEGRQAETAVKVKTAENFDADHKAIVESRIAQTETYKTENILKTLQADAAKMVTEGRKELEVANNAKDSAAAERARQKIAAGEYSSKDDIQQVTAATSLAKLWWDATKATEQDIIKLQNAASPSADRLIAELEKNLEHQRKMFNAATEEAERLRRRSQTNRDPNTPPAVEPPAANFHKKPAPVTGKPRGVIDTPTGRPELVSP